MNRAEVVNIVNEVLSDSARTMQFFVKEVPTLSTAKAANLLGFDRRWFYKPENRLLLGGRIKDRKGTLEFPTINVLKYKQQLLNN